VKFAKRCKINYPECRNFRSKKLYSEVRTTFIYLKATTRYFSVVET